MKRVYLAFSLSLFLVFPLYGQKYEVKFVHFAPPTHPIYKAVDYFSHLVFDMTGGSVKVVNYGARLMGDEREKLDGIMSGRFQMGAISTAVLSNYIPQFIVCDMPFMWPSEKVLHVILDTFLTKTLFSLATSKGIVGLSWFDGGFRIFSNNVRPIKAPEDMHGLKIRTLKNQIYIDTYRSLGAIPVTGVPFQELFLSLKKGEIDGQDSPLSITVMAKLTEYQKYITLSMWSYMGCPVIANARWFRSLPPDIKYVIKDAAYKAQVIERGLYFKGLVDNVEKAIEAGVDVEWIGPSGFEAFREKVKGVYEKWSPFIGQDFLDKVLKRVKSLQKGN